jgi:hypothetical protein
MAEKIIGHENIALLVPLPVVAPNPCAKTDSPSVYFLGTKRSRKLQRRSRCFDQSAATIARYTA